MCRFSEQEQRDLYTEGYETWCWIRWSEVKFRGDPDAIMVDRLVRRLQTQAKRIRHPAMVGVFVRGRQA